MLRSYLFTTSGSGSSVFYFCHKVPYLSCVIVSISVPDPDPLDPHVFGPSGSGSGSTIVRGLDPDPDLSIIKQN
jgi:hypothetical protein